MKNVEVYSKKQCPFCDRAKLLLGSKGIDYREIDITDDEALTIEMVQRSRQRTVPQIFIDDEAIGGYDHLARLHSQGILNRKLDLEEKQAI